ncbi:15225_t:CDS:1, partial [Rhizophagus irregularis]
AGDIWMIGNLLNDLRILQIQLSARARNFRDRLTQQNHDERPSAADAIDDDWFSDM